MELLFHNKDALQGTIHKTRNDRQTSIINTLKVEQEMKNIRTN